MIRIFFPYMNFVKAEIMDGNVHAWTTVVNPHYSHYNTRDMRFEWYYKEEDYPGDIGKKVESFETFVESVREEKCKEIYKALEEEHDYLTSDEAVIDTIKADEYVFDEEGEIV